MKKTLVSLLAITLCLAACEKYDDSALVERIDQLDSRVQELETKLVQVSSNINSLQSAIATLQSQDYVTDVKPLYGKDGVSIIGYQIIYKTAPATNLYISYPETLGMKQENGVYYWAIGDQFVLIDGQKVRVSAQTPQIKQENGAIYASFDGGKTWNKVSDVVEFSYDDESVTIKVGTETVSIPLVQTFSLKVETTKVSFTPVEEGYSAEIPYTIKGAKEGDEIVVLPTYVSEGWTVEMGEGKFTVSSKLSEGTIVLTAVNNTTGATSSQAISFSANQLSVSYEALLVAGGDTTAEITVTTNVDYTVEPAVEWITVPSTKGLRVETVTLAIAANPGLTRIGEVKIKGNDGSETVVVITQKVNTSKTGITALFGIQPTVENPQGFTADANSSIAVIGDYLILSNSLDVTKMPVYDRWTGEYLGSDIVNVEGVEPSLHFFAVTNDDAGHLVALSYVDSRATPLYNNGTVRGWVWKDGIDKKPASVWWAGYYNYGLGASYGFRTVKVAGDLTKNAVLGTIGSAYAVFETFVDGKLTLQNKTALKEPLYGSSTWYAGCAIPISTTASTIDELKYISVSGNWHQYINYSGDFNFAQTTDGNENMTSPLWYNGASKYGHTVVGGDYIEVGGKHLFATLNGWGAGGSFTNGQNKFYYQLVLSDIGATPTADSFKDGGIFGSRITPASETVIGTGYGEKGMISPFAYDGKSTMLGENLQEGDVEFAVGPDGSVQVYALITNFGLIGYTIK